MQSQSSECLWGILRVLLKVVQIGIIALATFGWLFVMIAWFLQVMQVFMVDNEFVGIEGNY